MSSIHYTLQYEPYPAMESLNPGIKALEFNVLILPRKVADRQGSIFMPEKSREREDEGGDEGLLVAKSALAFPPDEFPPDAVPQIGRQVMFARYAGKSFVGADGRLYRLMKDKDVLGERVPTQAASMGAGI